MKNTLIKNFDANLANLINSALEQGIEISTIIIALDKYLFSARMLQRDILENEQYTIKQKMSNIESSTINATLEESINLEESIDESSTNENGEIA